MLPIPTGLGPSRNRNSVSRPPETPVCERRRALLASPVYERLAERREDVLRIQHREIRLQEGGELLRRAGQKQGIDDQIDDHKRKRRDEQAADGLDSLVNAAKKKVSLWINRTKVIVLAQMGSTN